MARHFGQEQYTLYKKVKRRQKALDDAFERAMIEEEEKEERRRRREQNAKEKQSVFGSEIK